MQLPVLIEVSIEMNGSELNDDELPDEYDIFGCNCSASIAQINRHVLPVCQNRNRNASPEGDLLCAHASPHGRCFGVGITGGQKQLRLMSTQRFGWLAACWPPLESTLR